MRLTLDKSASIDGKTATSIDISPNKLVLISITPNILLIIRYINIDINENIISLFLRKNGLPPIQRLNLKVFSSTSRIN